MDATDSGRNPVEELAEEFIERRRRGEAPSVEEYAGKFPEHADEIRSLFPALVMMEKLGAESGFYSEAASDRPRSRPPARLEQIGDFRILREVGRGGMGIVYEAEQESLGRRVALKVLSGHTVVDGEQVQRFEREARSAARLHHTNIVPVFGVGQQDGLHYYVMQFIQGQGLDEVLTELKRLRSLAPHNAAPITEAAHAAQSGERSAAGEVAESLLTGEFRGGNRPNDDGTPEDVAEAPYSLRHNGKADGTPAPQAGEQTGGTPAPLPCGCSADSSVTLPGESELSTVVKSDYQYARSVARIGIQVANALEYANGQGILHRDIKPSNLLLDLKGTVWVTDFGLAKAAEGADLTHPGDIVGTLRYMAPERFRGRCDARADVYSLGLTLYELLALRPAYDESDRQRLIQLVTQEQPSRLRRLRPTVPHDLATIIHKAISREPDHRYATAQALGEDLQRFIDDKPILARHILPLERLVRWGRRNPGLATLTAIVVVLLLTIAGISSLAAVRLRHALSETQTAKADTTDKLWESYLAQASAGRLTRQPGQRFDSLRAIREALKLPVPKDRSLDDLRNEAIACLCVTDDLEIAKEWDGCATGTTVVAVDDAFERYARDDHQGNVSIRRITDDRELLRLPGEGVALHDYCGLQFSPDGRFLHQVWPVDGGYRARLWRIDAAQPVAVLSDDHINLTFRPDGLQFAAAYPGGSIRFFDADTVHEVRRHSNILSQAAALLRWNPRLPQMAIMERRVCRVIDIDSGKSLSEIPVPGGADWIDWHPEGRVLAISSDGLKIYLYEVSDRRLVVPPLEGHKQYGILARFNHAGDRLVSNDWASIFRIWDTQTGRQLLAQPGTGNGLTFSRDDRLLAAEVDVPHVRLFHYHISHEFRTVALRSSASEGYRGHAVATLDGRLLAVWAPDGVSLVDMLRGEKVATLPLSGINEPCFFEPHDEALWTSGQNGLLRWPMRSDASRRKLQVGPPQAMGPATWINASAASTDAQVVCTPQRNEGALLWRRRTNEKVILGPQQDVRHVTVSPDGRWAATGSHTVASSSGAKVWHADTDTGDRVADLPVGGLCAVMFSPDSRWLVTTGGGARIWAVDSWQEGPTLAGARHTRDVCFSADSQLLALEGNPGEVRLVRTETGAELARLTAPEQTRLVPQVFTPDGTRLVTLGTETGTLHIFDLSSIRAQLVELGLDWEAPPLPPAPAIDVERLEVQVEMGNFKERVRADELVGLAGQHGSDKQYAQAAQALREAVRLDPTHAAAHNNLAWLLLTAPDDVRNPQEALPLARQAVELASNETLYQNTLGVALYRTGHFADAVEALETSLCESKGASDAFDLFFLAMCHHRLGDTGEATDCRDRAKLWFNQHRGKLPVAWVAELMEFQSEADRVFAQPPGSPIE
jgi:serine/threonine protein kinase/WD40 repeat protein